MANDVAEPTEALAYEPSDDAKKMCSDIIAELRKRELSSSENLDKSILTYSSAGLALSLGFLKDFISVRFASFPYLLYLSWALFAAATIITTVSFLVSYFAQGDMQARAERYYMQGDEKAFTEKNWFNSVLTIFNIVSTAAFVLAIVFTTVFVSVNLEKANQMSNRKVVYDGVPVPFMQKVQGSNDFNKGLPAPTLQQLPAAANRPAPATSQPVVPSSSPPANTKQ
jgi:hypothetical protein